MTSAGHGPSWSAPSGGLRARLVVRSDRARVPAGESVAIDIELENVGSAELRVMLGDPFAFTAKVEDASGREVAPTGSRLEVLSSPSAQAIAPGQRARSSLTTTHEDADVTLDLTTAMWQLAPGRYRVSGSFAGTGEDGTWVGTLDLPAVAIDVL